MRVVLWILISLLLYAVPAGAEEKKKTGADTPPCCFIHKEFRAVVRECKEKKAKGEFTCLDSRGNPKPFKSNSEWEKHTGSECVGLKSEDPGPPKGMDDED